MIIRKHRGLVKSFVTFLSSDESVVAENKTLAITFINQGASIVTLYASIGNIEIDPKGSYTLGGYDDYFRSEDIPVTFAGGTGSLKIVMDKEMQAPTFEVIKKPDYATSMEP